MAVAKTAAKKQDRAELLSLAQGVWLSQINAVGLIMSGDDLRQIVRSCRTFLDEVDNPTKPKPKPLAPRPQSSGPSVEGLYLEEDFQ